MVTCTDLAQCLEQLLGHCYKQVVYLNGERVVFVLCDSLVFSLVGTAATLVFVFGQVNLLLVSLLFVTLKALQMRFLPYQSRQL